MLKIDLEALFENERCGDCSGRTWGREPCFDDEGDGCSTCGDSGRVWLMTIGRLKRMIIEAYGALALASDYEDDPWFEVEVVVDDVVIAYQPLRDALHARIAGEPTRNHLVEKTHLDSVLRYLSRTRGRNGRAVLSAMSREEFAGWYRQLRARAKAAPPSERDLERARALFGACMPSRGGSW